MNFVELSAGQFDLQTWKTISIHVGQYINRYFDVWSKPSVAKILLTTDLDVAYGFAELEGVVKGLTLEKYHTAGYFMNKVSDDMIGSVYYHTFQEKTAENTGILYSYFYLGKFDRQDEIICLQHCEDENGNLYYFPLSFRHSLDEIQCMFSTILNFRYHVDYD